MSGPPRNTDVLSLVIQLDGSELPGSVNVLSLEVLSQVNRVPYARLALGDGDPARQEFSLSAGDTFLPGAELVVLAGYHGQTAEVFRGLVVGQRVVVGSGGSRLEVECRDAAVKMTLARKNRQFADSTDSDVVESLLSEAGLQTDIATTSVTHEELFQYQASDWDFMLSRLEANGMLCAVEGGSVRTFVPSLEAEPVLELSYGSSVLEFDAEFDARTQSGAVKAVAWDPAAQDLIEVDAADPGWTGNGDLTSSDMTAVTAREEDRLLHGGALKSDALQAWADGALLRSRLAACQGRVRMQGSSDVKLGSVVELSGFGARFDGKVFVSGVRHEFTSNDWLTDAEFGLVWASHAETFAVEHAPAGGLCPAVRGLQIGVVTQLADDPDGEHRIRVKVPHAGMDEQGVWARVATLDAGDGRGTFFRPEVDDEVVLGFFDDDPTQPAVLGMLHSKAKAPPLEATEDNHVKTYVSRSKISLSFDDDKKVFTLETPGGNRLVLSDDDGGILVEDQNGNSIELGKDGITLTSAKDLILKASGDLKGEGVNAALKASASFKSEGGSSAEVSSSGQLTVKGLVVQIN